MQSSYNKLDKVYQFIKFISISFILISGLLIAFKDKLTFTLIVSIPTVTLFTIHILGAFSLISSVLFITVFNIYNRKPLISIGIPNLFNIWLHFVFPITILFTGIVGLVVWEPFRWTVPFWAFNLSWEFIYSFKNIHFISTYFVMTAILFLILFQFISKKK